MLFQKFPNVSLGRSLLIAVLSKNQRPSNWIVINRPFARRFLLVSANRSRSRPATRALQRRWIFNFLNTGHRDYRNRSFSASCSCDIDDTLLPLNETSLGFSNNHCHAQFLRGVSRDRAAGRVVEKKGGQVE